MQKPTHINFWYSTMFSSAYFLNVFSPIFILLPFLAILADADHWQDSLSKKWLSLPGKHRGWSHSLLGSFILWNIVYLLLIWIFSIVHILWYNISTAVTISNLIHWDVYVGILIGSILLTLWLLIKFFKIKLIQNILWWIALFWYIIWLLYLYKLWTIELSYMLILLFIVSHIIWDYFTVSGIPICWGITNNRVRSLIYVSTGKIWETVVNLIVTILNIALIVLLVIHWYFNHISYNVWAKDVILLWFSWIILLYFMSKELSYSFIKKQRKEWISSVFSIIKNLVIYIVIVLWLGILAMSSYKFIWIDINIILGIYLIAVIIFWYVYLKKIFKELLDLGNVFVYLLIIVLQLIVTMYVLYLFFK